MSNRRIIRTINKTCLECSQSFEVFSTIAWRTDYCHQCRKEKKSRFMHDYRKNHREAVNAQQRKYIKIHSKDVRHRKRKYYKKHKGEIKVRGRETRKKAYWTLQPYIVRKILSQGIGIPTILITEELIKEKRDLIFLNRKIRAIKKEVSNEEIRL